jgi:type I restriction enzyme S subunit
MNEWREVRLGDVLDVENRRLGVAEIEPPVLSVTKDRGLVRADEYFGKRVASVNLNQYKVVIQDGWAFSTIHIDEGSIARNSLGYTGVVSPMYTTMRWTGTNDDPEYYELLLKSPQMKRQYFDNAQGTVNRRRSLPFKTFAGLRVLVPSLPEQRRIADLIQSIDGQAAALDLEAKTVEELLHRLLDQAWVTADEAIPVGSVADLASGPSWAVADERLGPEPGTTPVIKITNTRPDGRLDLSERLYVKGLPSSTRLLDDRSLIAIRTNGNRERIGNVYLPNDEVLGSAVSAFQFIVQCQSSDHRDHLYWIMRAPQCQRLMSDAASGSTGLGNMGARWLRALEIPWPDAEARTRFVERASVTACLHEGLLDECASLRLVRSTLLTSLLSGQMTIPESYDALLAEAV